MINVSCKDKTPDRVTYILQMKKLRHTDWHRLIQGRWRTKTQAFWVRTLTCQVIWRDLLSSF